MLVLLPCIHLTDSLHGPQSIYPMPQEKAERPTFSLSLRLLRIVSLLVREFYSLLVCGGHVFRLFGCQEGQRFAIASNFGF